MSDILRYQFIQKITELPFVDAIYLYGSRSRGDHHPTSDIDLAVLCPDANPLEWDQVMEIVEHADTLLMIDCLRYDKLPDNSKIKQAIDKDKQVIYARK